MGENLPPLNFSRRGSLSLTQTLSLDWTPPPPQTDLGQIHASSSQAPGLTSFSLGSPPSRNAEQLSLNKIYSRVKSFAGVVRDAVGASGSGSNPDSPTKSAWSGKFGSEQYFNQSESRDSFLSIATASDDGTAAKNSILLRGHLRQHSLVSVQSQSSSRVSSRNSMTSTTDYVQPSALRRLASTPRTTTSPAVAQVTVFRDGVEAIFDGGTSADVSRKSSVNNLHGVGPNSLNKNTAMSNGTVGALVGAVGSVINPTAGFSSAVSGNAVQSSEAAGHVSRRGGNSFADADEDSDDSASDETLSDSSDDDVVMLHSKLPAGAARGRPIQEGKDRNGKGSDLKIRTRTSISSTTNRESKPEMLLPPPATSDSATAPDSNMLLTPNDSHPPINTISPPVPVNGDSNLPQLSALNLQSKAPTRNPLRPPPMEQIAQKDAPRKKRLPTDQTLLLPGFKITGDRSSDADSSPAGTSMTGAEQKGEATSSVYRQGAFGDAGSGKIASGVHAGGLTGSTQAVSQALRQLRMGNLTRDFWMKDEVCKDCFLCGKTFSAWRRKHHCRLCGQIFCSKCTTLISGDQFGHQGSMRVCSPCLEIVNDYQDESNSDDFASAIVFGRSPAGSPKAISTPQGESSSTGFKMPNNLRPGQTPLMAIPATRTTAGSNPNRRSQILEINADIPSPPRPTSARSIKAFPRPVTPGSSKGLFGTSLLHSHLSPHAHPLHHHHHHKHARSHHRLSGVPFMDERAPFHRGIADEKRHQKLLPAFHADNIIDPDLAPYMNDGDESDEEQMSIFATMAPNIPEPHIGLNGMDSVGASTPATSTKAEKAPGSNSAARVRRVRSKSRGSISGLGNLMGGGESPSDKPGTQHKRATRRRGSSFIAPLQQRPVTRGKNRGLMRSLTESVGGQTNASAPGTPVAPSPRPSRSASMRGPLVPIVELNTASLEHVKKLLKQLLTDAEIPNVGQWEKALIPILLKCTDDLNPDIREGDDIDIRHYVKVKRIPGAKPADTSYISGVVFTKNLALKSMPRNLTQPRIVVLTFPIEYSRHQQQLMSLEPVIAQERDFLQNMINRIVALRPSLLLVEKNISGLALTLLAQANVATAYLVKPSVIEAVSRCAQADIFSSIDKLALSNFRLGRCTNFDVKTFVHNDIPGKKKTFMYLSGCQKELGCTIVLRGADMNTLAVIKRITELMVYVVYNLKLETCLMRDGFVVIPSSPIGLVAPAVMPKREEPQNQSVTSEPEKTAGLNADGTVDSTLQVGAEEDQKMVREANARPQQIGDTESEKIDELSQLLATGKEETIAPTISVVPLSDDRLPDDIPHPTYYEDMVRKHETKLLSASPFVSYMQPYLLTRARELERRLAYLRRLRDSLVIPEEEDDDGGYWDKDVSLSEKQEMLDPEKLALAEKPKPQESFLLVDPEAVHGGSDVKHGTSKKAKEVLRAIYDAEYDKALHVYETQKKQWENYLAQYDDLFDPFTHQSITILYSMVCTVTTVPCEGPEIRRLEFYDQDHDWDSGKSDCTLGQYIEYLCTTARLPCDSGSCDKKMIDHHRSYVHGQARVSVLVSDAIACPIEGLQNTILMWSYCKKCVNTNTPAIPMSESSWKYSFGKYLELAFWSSEMRIRAGNCPHDVNRDHVRCFGYRSYTVLFQYDPIDLLEIVVPRTRITYKPELDLRVKNEQYVQNEGKIKNFFSSVQARLKGINVESVSPDKIEACKAEIEILIIRAREDEDWLVSKLQEKYNKSKYYEIIPLNRALRALQETVIEWDTKFSAFDNQYFPSEKDIRRLATLQLKRIFLDNTSTPSLQSENDPTPSQEKGEETKAHSIDGADTPDLNSFSSEKAHDVFALVVEEDQEKDKGKQTISKSPEKSDNSSILTMEGAAVSSQEVAIQDDDSAAKQEASPEHLVPDTEPQPIRKSTSQPSTPMASMPDEKPKSILAISESDKMSENEASAQSSSKHVQRSSLPESRLLQVSAIPRPEPSRRRPPPTFSRTVSVPEVPRRKDLAGPLSAGLGRRSPTTMPSKKPPVTGKTTEKIRSEKKPDKFRLTSLSKKPKDKEPQSQIPRSVPSTNMSTGANMNMNIGMKRPIMQAPKVSSLAKHFEQLGKEFERKRAKERRQLAAKRARALPVATSRPIVEVYRNAREAVEEASDEEQVIGRVLEPPERETSNLTVSSESTFQTILPVLSPEDSISPPEPDVDQMATTPDTLSEHPAHVTPLSQSHSDLYVDASDGEMSMASDQETLAVPSMGDALPPVADTDVESAQLDLKLELPQQHRSAWMKMLSNFWAERSASGWASLDYPLHPTDHVFNDSDIIVREDEPSSLIAFTLGCSDYIEKLNDIRNSDYSHIGSDRPSGSEEQVHNYSFNLQEHPELERSLLKTTGTHLKYVFQEGTAKMLCKIFYAEQFDALRRNCGIADRYVESLSRCIKWDSKGGKTRSVFLKTQDGRIILKSLSPIETEAFIKFAPAYFQFMSEAFFHELPTVIAKMLGFYQIMIKNPSTGTEIKWDILVMENLFYDRKTTRIFDLKGSMRNRYTQSTGEQNEVLLDENMVEFIYESPLFVREHSKKLLRASLWNDTLFLSRQNVMDYSLMIGIDENRKELCVGIIDCIRTFTWDKKLESWVKEKGFAGGGRNKPTVTSPREYKHRFREAMERYVLEAPSCWHLFRMNQMGALPLQLHSRGREREVDAGGEWEEVVPYEESTATTH